MIEYRDAVTGYAIRRYTEGPERAVCDFIGCMTDRYAIDQFGALFVPNAFDKK